MWNIVLGMSTHPPRHRLGILVHLPGKSNRRTFLWYEYFLINLNMGICRSISGFSYSTGDITTDQGSNNLLARNVLSPGLGLAKCFLRTTNITVHVQRGEMFQKIREKHLEYARPLTRSPALSRAAEDCSALAPSLQPRRRNCGSRGSRRRRRSCCGPTSGAHDEQSNRTERRCGSICGRRQPTVQPRLEPRCVICIVVLAGIQRFCKR